uniref:Uncharacterized protein n=1 Tax=viral metagenome TaxID=1070528 RepID=A0A2V0RC24_9ZZZZ
MTISSQPIKAGLITEQLQTNDRTVRSAVNAQFKAKQVQRLADSVERNATIQYYAGVGAISFVVLGIVVLPIVVLLTLVYKITSVARFFKCLIPQLLYQLVYPFDREERIAALALIGCPPLNKKGPAVQGQDFDPREALEGSYLPGPWGTSTDTATFANALAWYNETKAGDDPPYVE